MPPRLIYLHGFASSPASTKANYFAERFRALGSDLTIPDLAQGDFERLTVSKQLAVMEDAAGAGTVSLIGSSMGGYLAALFASRFPARVDRLVLLAPAFGFVRRWPAVFGEERFQQWRDQGWMTVFHYGEQRERRLGFQLYVDAQQYPDFPDFSHPALIIHGRADTVVPLSLSEQFAATHPNVDLRPVDAGHELTEALPEAWSWSRGFLHPGAVE